MGVEFGAHTTAKDSGSICWKPECVCKSTEDMKPKLCSMKLFLDEASTTYRIAWGACGSACQINVDRRGE